MTPLEAITTTLEDCRTLIPAVQAERVLATLQGLYVPPPPGSDRDALPVHLRGLIEPQMRPYLSTYCETARACHLAAEVFPDHADELRAWEQREHDGCRVSRKQDMAECVCDCHRPAPAGQPPDAT